MGRPQDLGVGDRGRDGRPRGPPGRQQQAAGSGVEVVQRLPLHWNFVPDGSSSSAVSTRSDSDGVADAAQGLQFIVERRRRPMRALRKPAHKEYELEADSDSDSDRAAPRAVGRGASAEPRCASSPSGGSRHRARDAVARLWTLGSETPRGGSASHDVVLQMDEAEPPRTAWASMSRRWHAMVAAGGSLGRTARASQLTGASTAAAPQRLAMQAWGA
mmetsp:Transcript_23724/g.68248  ORF Transcript_23724/g.68248 Transcript_23724/m.68248 type:complete len:217 (+) Transcript_23724:92-742(+)